MTLKDILHDAFLNREITGNEKLLTDKFVSKEKIFISTLTKEQLNMYTNMVNLLAQIDLTKEKELVAFVLKMLSLR